MRNSFPRELGMLYSYNIHTKQSNIQEDISLIQIIFAYNPKNIKITLHRLSEGSYLKLSFAGV